MDAWRLDTPQLSVILTRIGAHVVSITSPGSDCNPLWVPPWPGNQPLDSGIYGSGPEAALLAVISGSNLCLDRFGAPWPGEQKPIHGEAGVATWTGWQTGESFILHAHLPVARLDVERQITIAGHTVTIKTIVQDLSGTTRSIEWAEHPTLGDPFLDGATFEAGVDKAITAPEDDGPDGRLQVPPLSEVDPSALLAMPPASHTGPFGDIGTCRVTDGFWRAQNKNIGRVFECRWNAEEFPWLCVWTQGRSRTTPPWNGQTRSRGLEFSTKPFPEGKPPAERAETFYGRPTTCMINANGQLERQFTFRWAMI